MPSQYEDTINRLYRELFGRDADAGALGHRVAQLQSSGEGAVRKDLMSSREYLLRNDPIYAGMMKEEELQRNQRLAGVEATINRLRSQEASGTAEYESQLRDTEANRVFQRGETERQYAQARPKMQEGLSSRGLALSGIREGSEARHSDALMRGLGAIDLGYSQQSGSIQRALDRLRQETSLGVAEQEAQRKFLTPQAPAQAAGPNPAEQQLAADVQKYGAAAYQHGTPEYYARLKKQLEEAKGY